MAEVSSNSPCTMLGKRVLSPSHHNAHVGGSSIIASSGQHQLDFGSGSTKKRQRIGGTDEGPFGRPELGGNIAANELNVNQRSFSPVHPGKRARPLSHLHTSFTQLAGPSFGGAEVSRGGLFGLSQHSKQADVASFRDPEDQELVALRRQVGELRAHAAEKESDLTAAQAENERLRNGVSMCQKEMERLTSENRIFKRAVGIQNTKSKELENQVRNLQQTTGQAAEYIKRLEQTNYALSVRVQAIGSSGLSDFMGGQRPPDVY